MLSTATTRRSSLSASPRRLSSRHKTWCTTLQPSSRHTLAPHRRRPLRLLISPPYHLRYLRPHWRQYPRLLPLWRHRRQCHQLCFVSLLLLLPPPPLLSLLLSWPSCPSCSRRSSPSSTTPSVRDSRCRLSPLPHALRLWHSPPSLALPSPPCCATTRILHCLALRPPSLPLRSLCLCLCCSRRLSPLPPLRRVLRPCRCPRRTACCCRCWGRWTARWA